MVKDRQGRVLKVGVIVYTIDPENNMRFLLRYSKPFNGYYVELDSMRSLPHVLKGKLENPWFSFIIIT